MNEEHTPIFKDVCGYNVPSFKYEPYPLLGVGKYRTPLVSMDRFIDHSQDEMLHIESCKGLALCNDYKMGLIFGQMPPEEEDRLNNKTTWSEILHNIEEHDPTGIHRQAITELIEQSPGQEFQSIFKYTYFAMGAVIPWFFNVYLKTNSFGGKTQDNPNWTENKKYFPNVVKYIEQLPFKSIGRVQYFTTFPNVPVPMHRDMVVSEHKDHSINLFFSAGWRPTFAWDSVNKVKHYLPKGTTSYYFNNRDYHGVDAEPVYRYTLRVDGTFTDELCEQLGLEDGYTWHKKYDV